MLAAQSESYDLGSLRMAAYLGEKLEPDRPRELMRRVCPEFSSFYGMSGCLGLGGCIVRGSDIGYVYLQGRADNQIATGGIKVAPGVPEG